MPTVGSATIKAFPVIPHVKRPQLDGYRGASSNLFREPLRPRPREARPWPDGYRGATTRTACEIFREPLHPRVNPAPRRREARNPVRSLSSHSCSGSGAEFGLMLSSTLTPEWLRLQSRITSMASRSLPTSIQDSQYACRRSPRVTLKPWRLAIPATRPEAID